MIDADGDPTTLFLHFVTPYAHEGTQITPEMEAVLDSTISTIIKMSTRVFSQITGNAVGLKVGPPDYMLNELESLLRT